jgi:hypothetical protein
MTKNTPAVHRDSQVNGEFHILFMEHPFLMKCIFTDLFML